MRFVAAMSDFDRHYLDPAKHMDAMEWHVHPRIGFGCGGPAAKMERRQMGRTDDERCRAASVPAVARLADSRHPACPAATWNTAHWQDARTALNAIRGFAELMLAGSAGPLSADGLDYMRQIAAAGRTLDEALSMVATDEPR